MKGAVLALGLAASAFAAHLGPGLVNAEPEPAEPGRAGESASTSAPATDVLHYRLALRVDPKHKSIDGTLAIRARLLQPAKHFDLDLDGRLRVQGVRSGETTLPFEHRADRIHVDLGPLGGPLPEGKLVELEVAYGGRPRVAPNPPWDGGFTWAETAAGEPWVGTSCQGDGAKLWWPCKDDASDEPESMDLSITVPTGLFVATNGRFVGSAEEREGWTTFDWHVSTPINTYGVALNIAPYERLEQPYESITGESLPVIFWVLPEHVEQGRAILPEFVQHLSFFERTLGPYPFRGDKYGVAETPYLGMEHQTIIAYGNRFRPDPRGFDWLHHHELAHEWWGNLATAGDWRDFWIHESFATYAQALYAEELGGAQAYRDYMQSFRQLRNERPVAPRAPRDAESAYFGGVRSARSAPDNDVYYKGAWALHTLRWLMGDEPYFRAQRRLVYPDPELARTRDGSACHFVTTEDFQALAGEEHGATLEWFFEAYLRQPVLPRLVEERRNGELRLRWELPAGLDFPMPVEVEVDGERRRHDVPPEGLRLGVPRGVEVRVDPDRWILREE